VLQIREGCLQGCHKLAVQHLLYYMQGSSWVGLWQPGDARTGKSSTQHMVAGWLMHHALSQTTARLLLHLHLFRN
jgi:hypothetical protein